MIATHCHSESYSGLAMRLMTSLLLIATTVSMGRCAEATSQLSVSYARDIAPILQQKCVACHRDKQSEGGLSLETTAALMRGGDSGASIVPENLDDSVLFARVSGGEEPLMPPEDNAVGAKPLTDKEVDLLRRWILGGAPVNATEKVAPLDVQPIPKSIRDSFALDASPDGSIVAVGRANRVDLLDEKTGQPVGQLIDPSLDQDGAADIDFIQAIKFSPSGDRIATGGFRTTRIWQRTADTPALPKALQGATRSIAISPDRTRAASVNAIGDVEVWDLKDSKLISSIPRSGTSPQLCWDCSTQLVIVDDSGTLRLIDPETGAVAGTIPLDGSIKQVTQSVDGRYTAVLGHDQRIRVFESATRLDLKLLSDVTDATAVAFPDNASLAVANQRGTIQVLEIASASIRNTLDHGSSVHAIAIDGDRTRLASGGAAGDTKLWNVGDGKLLATFVGDATTDLQLVFLEQDIQRETAWIDRLNSETLKLNERLKKEDEALAKVIAAKETAAKEAETKKIQLKETLAKVEAGTQAVAAKTKQIQSARQTITTSENAIASSQQAMNKVKARLQPLTQEAAAADQEVKVAEAQLAEAMKRLETARARAVKVSKQVVEQEQALATEADRQTDAMKAKENAEQAITKAKAEIESEKQTVAKLNESASTLKKEVTNASEELSQREQALATAQKTRDIAAAKVPTHQDMIRRHSNRLAGTQFRRERLVGRRDAGRPVAQLAFSPQGQFLAAVHDGGEAIVYDIKSGRKTAKLASSASNHASSVIDACFLDSERLLVPSTGGEPSLLRTVSQWKLQRVIGGVTSDLFDDRVTALDFSADGRSLAIGSGIPSRSGQVLIVDPSDGRVLRRYENVHSDMLLGLRFSPDDRLIATAASDKTIRLIDLQTNQVIGALDGHTHHVLSVVWNDAATMLASASADGTIKTWDAASGQRQRTMVNIADEITAVEFVPGTSRVVSAAADGNIRVHDAGNGNQVTTAGVPGDALFTLELSSDGSRVYASGQTGNVHVFTVDGLKRDTAWQSQQ